MINVKHMRVVIYNIYIYIYIYIYASAVCVCCILCVVAIMCVVACASFVLNVCGCHSMTSMCVLSVELQHACVQDTINVNLRYTDYL